MPHRKTARSQKKGCSRHVAVLYGSVDERDLVLLQSYRISSDTGSTDCARDAALFIERARLTCSDLLGMQRARYEEDV